MLQRIRTSKALRLSVSAVLFAALTGLGACTKRVDVRGNFPDPERLAKVEVGKQDRDAVLDLLGSPSSVAAFNDAKWYYVGEVTKTTAFLDPEILERDVVIITFDDQGKVGEIQRLGLEEARAIDPVDRKTPTVGKEIGVIEQLLGNFGRFTN